MVVSGPRLVYIPGVAHAGERRSRIQIAKPDIVQYFDQNSRKIFLRKDLARILDQQRAFWRLAHRTTATAFIDFLTTRSNLQAVELGPPGRTVRYSWGTPSVYELALSLARDSYLSHATALYLHALTDQIPKVVYVNREQSPKPAPQGTLRQESIDRAFAHEQRTSQYVFHYEETRIVLLSGKNTRRLEVGEFKGPDGAVVDCTKLERTLIDVTVRPGYAGGIFNVVEAYRRARPRVSSNVLAATLRKLDYVYPYHQAIGFLMERAGFEDTALNRLKSLGLEYDFYLVHGAKRTSYEASWRIHYPEGL